MMEYRSRFDKEMTEINQKVNEMGSLCLFQIEKTADCFKRQDRVLAQEVVDNDKQIDELYRQIEQQTFRVLLLEHPVATDFRQIGSALKLITDLERIGDYCADIADEVRIFPDEPYYPDTTMLLEMFKCVKTMLTKAMHDFDIHDVEDARKLDDDDDRVDIYFIKTKEYLLNILRFNENQFADETIIFMMIAKYLERIGDHIVNIGEWIDYSSTGTYEMS